MARSREPSSILLVTLLAVRVVILVVVFINVERNPVTDSDINRFQEIGELREHRGAMLLSSFRRVR